MALHHLLDMRLLFVCCKIRLMSVYIYFHLNNRGRRGRGSWIKKSMVIGFTTTCAISAYHHEGCEFGFVFPGTPVSSTNKTDRHDITKILSKVALNTRTPTPPIITWYGIVTLIRCISLCSRQLYNYKCCCFYKKKGQLPVLFT
jgi:hypothetical protein